MASVRRLTSALVRAADRTPALVYAAAVVPVGLVLVVVVTQPWMPPTDLVRDSQAVAALRGAARPSHGLVSNLGILVTAVSAGAALLATAFATSSPRRLRRLVGWAGGLTLVVALDDLLMLHEAATFASWIPKAIVVVYGTAFVGVLWRFRAEVVRHLDAGVLGIAMLAFGTSALVDVLATPPTVASVLVEDGAKLLGLVAWCVFVLRGAALLLLPRPGTADQAADAAPRARTDAAA